MKLAYISPRFHPFKGGAEQNLQAFAEYMVSQKNEVNILTAKVKFKNENLKSAENFNGMKIIRHWALNESLYAGFYPGLLFHLLRNKYDVIHTAGIGFLWREFCLIIYKIFNRNTKLICTPNGPFMALNDSKGIRGYAKRWGTRLLRSYLNNLYDIFIEVNNKQADWMVNEYGISKEKIFLIPNGINQNYIENNIVEHNDEEPVVITYMNRLEEYKGIHQVLKALNKLKTENRLPKTIFYIMGRPGGYSETLHEMVKEFQLEKFTKFIESPSDEERDRIFKFESQINILPSKFEATGIVLLEAMAKGNIPITTFQNEACDIIIKDNETGFVYDYEDINSLAEIIVKIATDNNLRKEMRLKNIQLVKNFTWEAVYDKYLKIINK